MPAYRKASVRELTADAYELDSSILQGRLHRDPSTGIWKVGDTSLDVWLTQYGDEEIVLIATSLDDERPMPVKTCRTCGTEYQGTHCPRCREARIRLRGR